MIKRRLHTITAAAAAALLSLTACGGSADQAHSTTRSGPPGVSSSPGAAQAHNSEDVTFAQRMIAHHQQAVQMSDIILGKPGVDPRVVDLANQIKAAQGPEIQQMQTWLNQWSQPTNPTTPGSMTPGAPNHGDMPGMTGMDGMMMSEQDIQALTNAQGVDASKLFLTQMIQHHQGAITMAQNEIKSGQYPPAVSLAHSIVTDQQQEITTMTKVLNSL